MPETATLLVIDHDENYAQQLAEKLEEAGYKVRVVRKGFEGLQAVQETKPAAAILDLDLPDMDGYGLLVAMRSHDALRATPVLVLTARELTDSELARLDHPHTRYLNKATCDAQDVLEGVQEVLS